jgi:hypothetical protein
VQASRYASPEPANDTSTWPDAARGLVEIHTGSNLKTAGHWDLYASHRAHLTDLITAHGPRPRLGVLGAGNANDLDLDRLTAAFQAIHLADLDASALARAAHRQSPETRRQLALHPERDLSGLLDHLPAWRENPPDAAELARTAPRAAARITAALPGLFDVVVSDCVLSQISWTCFKAVGAGPSLTPILETALAAHLRALIALTRPGGRCLLVSDVISSDTFPLDPLFPLLDAGALLRHLDRAGRLFSGTSPGLARATLYNDPKLADAVEDVSVVEPWLWRLSPTRTVLVYALAFRRRASVKNASVRIA